MSTIAFVTTMPTSINPPIIPATPSGIWVMISRAMAPVAAKGMETSRISGCTIDRKAATMIR